MNTGNSLTDTDPWLNLWTGRVARSHAGVRASVFVGE